MPPTESHACPRCGTLFTCKAGAISACDCSGVNLSSADLAELRERFDGCLCVRCLSTIKAERKRLHAEGQPQTTPLAFTPPFHLRTPMKSS